MAVENLLAVYSLDALESSHPVSVPIGHPSEISQIFDHISYKKGTNVLIVLQLQISSSYPCGKMNSEALHALVMFGSEIFIVYR